MSDVCDKLNNCDCMKKMAFILVFGAVVCAFKGQPEFEKQVLGYFDYFFRYLPQEKVYLHTDKSTYTVGENVWFRAYQVHAALERPMLFSRFVYVDLVDKRDTLVSRVKVAAFDSCFYGQLRLPESLQQGEYCLRAYTYNMQNLGDAFVFKKKIRVINPKDSRLWVDVAYEKRGRNNYVARIRLTDNAGDPYVHMPLTYLTGERQNRYSETRARTDKDGVFEVKIDTSVHTISLKSDDYAELAFSRDIHVPEQLGEFDVQFFPEGGHLLSNNWQTVAFKAIGQDGRAVDVSGIVYQDSVPIARVAAEHDGMGAFRLPVTPGCHYHAMMRMGNGLEQRFDLPLSDDSVWGISVEQNDTVLTYTVLKGAKAVFPGSLYLLMHCRGQLLALQPLNGESKGKIDMRGVPEGISHLVLMDDQCNVYSQRLVFHKLKRRPELEIVTSRPAYTARDLVEMELGFEDGYSELLDGTFSLTVTDDSKVVQDSVEDNILSNLLLTSDIRGHIDNPGYYFNDTSALVDRHLDLVMLTHGWTRFDPAKIARGQMPPQDYEVEVGQVISGRVKNFWGGKSKDANIIIISNYGHALETTADSLGRFLVDGIAYREGTEFFAQALSRKGRRGVSILLDPDRLLVPRYAFPNAMSHKEEEDAFLKRFSQDYYYEDGVKVYVLDEVTVTRRKRKKTYSFYDNMATYSLDSAELSEFPDYAWDLIAMEIPGVTLERGENGEEYFARYGKRLYTLVNDFEEEMSFIKLISLKAVKQISYLDPMQSRIFFGDRAADGALIISMDPGYTPPPAPKPNTMAFTPLGFQVPEAFYVPKYDVDSVRRDNRYDVRTTIYWQPVVDIAPGRPAKVSFYTADVPGSYSVILEGVTRDGIVCRKRISLPVK